MFVRFGIPLPLGMQAKTNARTAIMMRIVVILKPFLFFSAANLGFSRESCKGKSLFFEEKIPMSSHSPLPLLDDATDTLQFLLAHAGRDPSD